MAKIKKKRTVEYKVFAQRLSETNHKWLAEKKKIFKSWNLFFNEIKERYEINDN
jgi:hypothetical protein